MLVQVRNWVCLCRQTRYFLWLFVHTIAIFIWYWNVSCSSKGYSSILWGVLGTSVLH